MKDNQAKYPQLRFKGFTDPWEQHKLGEVVEMFNGDRGINYPKNNDLVPEGVPFINAGDLQNGQVNLESCKKISKEKFNQLSGAKIRRGDILYCLRGTIGKNALVEFDEGTVASSLVDIRPKNIDRMYLFIILNSNIEYRQRLLNDEGAAQPNLSVRNLSKFYIPVPQTKEQHKISVFFKSFNELLTLHQRKLAKLKELKQGYLQKLFPKNGSKFPQLRFAGFADAWEQRKLGEIVDRFDNLRIPVTASKREKGTTPYYGANGIQDYIKGYTHDGNFVLVAEDGANDLQNYPVHYVSGKVWVNNHAHVIQGKNGIVDNLFLVNAIKGIKFETYLVGGSRAKLNADTMMKLSIKAPSFSEQQQIGSYFSKLDSLIALHQRKLEKLQEFKKGYLQKMFC